MVAQTYAGCLRLTIHRLRNTPQGAPTKPVGSATVYVRVCSLAVVRVLTFGTRHDSLPLRSSPSVPREAFNRLSFSPARSCYIAPFCRSLCGLSVLSAALSRSLGPLGRWSRTGSPGALGSYIAPNRHVPPFLVATGLSTDTELMTSTCREVQALPLVSIRCISRKTIVEA